MFREISNIVSILAEIRRAALAWQLFSFFQFIYFDFDDAALHFRFIFFAMCFPDLKAFVLKKRLIGFTDVSNNLWILVFQGFCYYEFKQLVGYPLQVGNSIDEILGKNSEVSSLHWKAGSILWPPAIIRENFVESVNFTGIKFLTFRK